MYLYSFFNLGARWNGWLASRPCRFTAEKETRYPLCRGLGGTQGRSGRVWKISPPTGIRSRERPARSKSLYRMSHRGASHRPIFNCYLQPYTWYSWFATENIGRQDTCQATLCCSPLRFLFSSPLDLSSHYTSLSCLINDLSKSQYLFLIWQNKSWIGLFWLHALIWLQLPIWLPVRRTVSWKHRAGLEVEIKKYRFLWLHGVISTVTRLRAGQPEVSYFYSRPKGKHFSLLLNIQSGSEV